MGIHEEVKSLLDLRQRELVGDERSQVEATLFEELQAGLKVPIITRPNPAEGMGTAVVERLRQSMPSQVSGVILAGGTSRRMGRDKAFLMLADQPLIAVVAERLRAVVDEVIIVADDTQRYSVFADRCVPDIHSGIGTLGGIHAGLLAAAHELALVVGCDMPFLNPDLLAWLVDAADGADLVVLKHDLGVEPLHAAYRKTCLPAIEATIRSGVRCAYAFYDQIQARFVNPAEIASLDPNLHSFCSVNTPDQWCEALIQTGVARQGP